jgi:beta-galactosidase
MVDAAPGGVFIVTADITDKAGNHIYGARNTVRWEVEGPATLVGPAEYVSQFGDEAARTGSLYIDMPVSNVVRPTGEPGEIRVRVSADGLASAETVVRAIPCKIKKSITR